MLLARAVLDDCEAAFLELKSASQDLLRRRWFTTTRIRYSRLVNGPTPCANLSVWERSTSCLRTRHLVHVCRFTTRMSSTNSRCHDSSPKHHASTVNTARK
jgi:hypothetical protein